MPGLGVTACEIESERHSIIVEPNVPVIDGKVAKYPNERWQFQILGIRKGISVEAIKSYLTNSEIEYKKILVTPESYPRLVKAFEQLNIERYKDAFFFLIDECEKFIQDADFRKGMTEIMREFWSYRNKAMVSATPLIPSDKNFVKQGFRQLTIQPHFDYSKPLTFIATNSVLKCVAEQVELLQGKRICFFINSIDMIHSLIRALSIQESSRIFSSDDAIPKLKDLGYTNYSSVINTNESGYADLCPFNFFTSRFYSAVDIDLEENGTAVIIVTDNYFAEHSAVDPKTHVKQILGRFRNKTIDNYHISNIRDDIEFKSKEYILSYIDGSFSAFKALHTLCQSEEDSVRKEALSDALKQLKFYDYTYIHNNKICINHYLIDNEIEYEQVKRLYTDRELLHDVYRSDLYFEFYAKYNKYNSEDRLIYLRNSLNLNQLRKEIVGVQIQLLNGELNGDVADYFTEYELQKEDGFILGAMHILAQEDLNDLHYREELINPVLNYFLNIEESAQKRFKIELRETFKKGKTYSEGYIKYNLQPLLSKYGLDKKVKATSLKDYCLLSDRVTVGIKGFKLADEKRPKGYKIVEYLHSLE